MELRLIRMCRIQWCCSCFFVFNWKYPFWANLVQKIIIFSLSWNLVLRLIRICRIQSCRSFFMFSTENTLFRQIWSKKSKIVNFSWNLVPKLIRICAIQWWCSLFLFEAFLCKSFPKKSIWHFDVTWLSSQTFTRRDVYSQKPVAFLVRNWNKNKKNK